MLERMNIEEFKKYPKVEKVFANLSIKEISNLQVIPVDQLLKLLPEKFPGLTPDEYIAILNVLAKFCMNNKIDKSK